MFAAYEAVRKGTSDSFQFKLVDGRVSLFGCNNGWIPWLLGMTMPKGQGEPYRWHLRLETALGKEQAQEFARKEYKRNVNALLINIKPGSQELFLCELLDVCGFSASGWTPMLWHLRILEPKSTKCTPNRFDDFTAARKGDNVYEFLYAMGTVRDGKLKGTWIAPKSSPTNGALLWPESLNYFMECIKGQTRRKLR